MSIWLVLTNVVWNLNARNTKYLYLKLEQFNYLGLVLAFSSSGREQKV